MEDARARGYKVTLVYIGLGMRELSQRRVADRVKAGGRNVSTKDIEHRVEQCLKNLPLALNLADRSIMLDNFGSPNPTNSFNRIQSDKVRCGEGAEMGKGTRARYNVGTQERAT